MGTTASFIIFLAVLAFVVWMEAKSRRARSAKAPKPEAPSDNAGTADLTSLDQVEIPADRKDSLATTLNRLGEQMQPTADAAATVDAMFDLPQFNEAVRLLSDPTAVGLDAVRQYALGWNWCLSCAAFEALTKRPDRQLVFAPIMAQFANMRPWPLHFALRYFDSLDNRPPSGAPATYAQEWWANATSIVESFLESFRRRRDLGDPPFFGDYVDAPNASSPETIAALLSQVDDPMAASLKWMLEQHVASRLDEAYLRGFGRFWKMGDASMLVEAQPWREALDRVEQAALSQPPRSVLVTGEARVGKSSFLRLLGERLARKGWRVFEASAAELMAGQIYIGELEGRIRRAVAELDAGKHVAWCVGDILQLAGSGTHRGQSASILDQIAQAMSAGRLVVLAEANPEGAVRLFQSIPGLRSEMEVVRLQPFSEADLAGLARDVASRFGSAGAPFAPEAVDSALHLATQYFGGAPAPGVVVDLLKRATQQAAAEQAAAVEPPHVLSALSLITGLPEAILDERQKVDLAAVRAFFAERVMGQEEAVGTVVDRIAMLKAGLIDPNRPVGVFLFAGPTGTGKTELAKTLAEFLFGSASRMARLDMSEFQTPDSTVKILGERGAANTDALVERVRKQPFSVVLLDEFEKAHANVWDLFLQVFDDGRLTDANGYVVDFRHTLIILTSNLGATSHRSSGMGFSPSKDAYSDEQVQKAISRTFRPEFVNRLDKVVVFKPLSREMMRAILGKELRLVLERRGLRNRDWAVEWEPSALDFLLDRGFTPEMGARPLKRAIDQHLLAPLAATLVEHRFPEGDQFLFVRSNGKAIEVEFVDPDADASVTLPGEETAGASLAQMILQPEGTQAENASLMASLEAVKARGDSAEWNGLKARLADAASLPEFWSNPGRHGVFARLALMDRVREATHTAERLERRLEPSARAGHPSRELIARLALQIRLIEEGIDDVFEDAPIDVALMVEPALAGGAEDAAQAAWRGRIEAMYRAWGSRRHMQVEELVAPKSNPGPVILRVTGFGAWRTLSGEAGLHVYETGVKEGAAGRLTARVKVVAGPSEDPTPRRAPAVLSELLAEAKVSSTVVRRYREKPSPLVRDKSGWRTGRLDAILGGDFDLIAASSAEAR